MKPIEEINSELATGMLGWTLACADVYATTKYGGACDEGLYSSDCIDMDDWQPHEDYNQIHEYLIPKIVKLNILPEVVDAIVDILGCRTTPYSLGMALLTAPAETIVRAIHKAWKESE